MGAGIPMGIGAKLTAPDRLVVVVCGDFGFGLSAMELETAVRHRIPIVVMVINNDGLVGASRQASVLSARARGVVQPLSASPQGTSGSPVCWGATNSS